MNNDLGTILINSSDVFLLGVLLTFTLSGIFGLYITGVALFDLGVNLPGANRFSNRQASFAGSLIRLPLGGALMVLSVLMWAAADTFAGGGSKTAALFDYGSGSTTGYCDQIRMATNYLFMLVGAIAIFRSAFIIHARQDGASAHSTGSPWGYFVFGTLTFFITDVTAAISNTIGMPVGLDNLCKVLQ